MDSLAISEAARTLSRAGHAKRGNGQPKMDNDDRLDVVEMELRYLRREMLRRLAQLERKFVEREYGLTGRCPECNR